MCSLLSLDSLNRLFRSIHRRCSVKNVFLKVSQISQEYTCVGVSFNKVEGQQLFLKSLQHNYFPVKFAKFSRTAIIKCICERLLLIFRIQHNLYLLCLANFIRFKINRLQSTYFLNIRTLFDQMPI